MSSQVSPVTSRVPQRTVLGPSLFSTYINDLPDRLHSDVMLFADNAISCSVIVNDTDCDNTKDLHNVEQWQHLW